MMLANLSTQTDGIEAIVSVFVDPGEKGNILGGI